MSGTRLEFEGAAGTDASQITAEAEAEFAVLEKESINAQTDVEVNIASVEEYARGADSAMPTLAARIGFDFSELPPLEKLSDDQVATLLGELIPLLILFGKTFAGPKDFPPRLTYPIVLKMTQATHMTSMDGGWVDDGCTGEQIGCTWGMYCPCLRYRKREDFEKKGGAKDYPSDRFFQGEGDPFSYPEPAAEEKAKRAAFDKLSADEQIKAIMAERANDPPCSWHGEACGSR